MAVEHLEKIVRFAELGEAVAALVRQSGVLREPSRRRGAARRASGDNPGHTRTSKRGRTLAGVSDELGRT